MPDRTYGSRPSVEINGEALTEGAEGLILEIVVDQDLLAPGACELHFSDPMKSLLSDTGLELGATIDVEASAVTSSEATPIFSGTVHAIDVCYGKQGQVVSIVAYDDAYALSQLRFSRSFKDVTLSDVFSDICAEAGVSLGSVEVENVVFADIGLFDETPWEFMTRHAQASGCIVRCIDGTIEVTKPRPASEAPSPGDQESTEALQLVPGRNLISLHLHASSARQVAEVEVRGWDPAQKKELVANATAETELLEPEQNRASVASDLGAAVLVEPRPTLTDQARCDHHAASRASQLAAAFQTADGEAIGEPQIAAGEVISLGAVDSQAGRFVVTSARHRFDTDGYFTEFQCSGIRDLSLFGLVGVEQSGRSIPGVVPAIVTDVADPDSLGRVRLRLPWLSDDYETGWARVAQIGAGPERGLLWFPEVEDEVAVAFISGDPLSPVVMGGMFNGVDEAPFPSFVDSSSGEVVVRGMKSRIGHAFILTDTAGEESIALESADGTVSVVLDQAGTRISLASDGDVLVDAQGEVVINSSGDTKVNAGGNAVLRAGQELTIEAGTNLNLKAGAQVNVSGAVINLN